MYHQHRSVTTDRSHMRALWDAAFGLQATDGLMPSAYARTLANANVDGRLTLEEAERNLDAHYRHVERDRGARPHEEEADKVSLHIVQLLEDASFTFDPQMLTRIHAHLFHGIDDSLFCPGAYKDEQLVKPERILNGDSVLYGAPYLFQRSLEVLFAREFDHVYASYEDGPHLSWVDADTLARLIADVWMVHPFTEGNTRTVAVFLTLYLMCLGYTVNMRPFARHASYLRDALVRASYQNRALQVLPDTSHLTQFLSSLVEDGDAALDYDALWCTPLFEHPDRVRNVPPAYAKPIQDELVRLGVTERILRRTQGDGS